MFAYTHAGLVVSNICYGISYVSLSYGRHTALLCPANSHYELRTPMCPETCVNPDKTQITCNETGFVEGCLCNDGFILSDEECVPLSECGCLVETEKEISYYKVFDEFSVFNKINVSVLTFLH